MTYLSITNKTASIQTNFINPIKTKMTTWKEYLSYLVTKHKKQNPAVPKVAQVFSEVKPMANTPSQELSVVASDSAKPIVPEKLKAVIEKVGENSLTARVMSAVSNVQLLSESELEWQDAFHEGGTEYIDGIKPSDMSKSVMWGIDRWNRPYVALKVCEVNGKDNKAGVETIFQRYTDDGKIWTSGKHYLGLKNYACLVSSRLGELEFNLFNELIKGQEVTYLTYDDSGLKVKLAK